jgi:hypothetical protein
MQSNNSEGMKIEIPITEGFLSEESVRLLQPKSHSSVDAWGQSLL